MPDLPTFSDHTLPPALETALAGRCIADQTLIALAHDGYASGVEAQLRGADRYAVAIAAARAAGCEDQVLALESTIGMPDRRMRYFAQLIVVLDSLHRVDERMAHLAASQVMALRASRDSCSRFLRSTLVSAGVEPDDVAFTQTEHHGAHPDRTPELVLELRQLRAQRDQVLTLHRPFTLDAAGARKHNIVAIWLEDGEELPEGHACGAWADGSQCDPSRGMHFALACVECRGYGGPDGESDAFALWPCSTVQGYGLAAWATVNAEPVVDDTLTGGEL